jgi:hypothetical protein
MDKITLLRFVGDGTTLGANANALEGEIGGSINESINKAIDIAVQAAVIQTINEGARKGHWAFKANKVSTPVLENIAPSKKDVKVEEKKDVVVQSQTKSETKTEAAPSTSAEVKKDVLVNKP